MSEIESGGPAFPGSYTGQHGEIRWSDGMTKREWYAGMALQGILHKSDYVAKACAEAVVSDIGHGRPWSEISFLKILTDSAYAYADAMIKAGKRDK